MTILLDIPIYSVAIAGALIINVGLYLCNMPSKDVEIKCSYTEVGLIIICFTLSSILLAILSGVWNHFDPDGYMGWVMGGFSIMLLLFLLIGVILFMHALNKVIVDILHYY